MKHLLSASEIEELAETRHVHQFNENALRMTRSIGEILDLERLGIHLVRLQSGYESTQFHYHEATEEFLYILSGRGIAEIGEESTEIGPGDFMAFSCPSLPHTLRNPFDEDLVYLVGGESRTFDVVHYPRIRRTMTKAQGHRRWSSWDDIHDV
jgi:uncharacterized cupin superfamily protein